MKMTSEMPHYRAAFRITALRPDADVWAVRDQIVGESNAPYRLPLGQPYAALTSHRERRWWRRERLLVVIPAPDREAALSLIAVARAESVPGVVKVRAWLDHWSPEGVQL